MDPRVLLGVSVASALANNLLLHRFGNRGLRGAGDLLAFNALVSCVWIVLLGAASRFALPSADAARWGILYGCVTAAFLCAKMQAMATGPVSVTAFVGCSSLLLSSSFGMLYFREKATVLQLAGMALLMVSCFLTLGPKNGGAQKHWKLWCGLFFLCGGAVGIIFKLQQSSPSRDETSQMMAAAAAVSAVLLGLLALLAGSKSGSAPKVPRSAAGYVLGCGAVSCVYNLLNLRLAGALPSIVFFPVFNGAVLLLSSLAGRIFFREKLRVSQLCGLVSGFCALLMVSGTADALLSAR